MGDNDRTIRFQFDLGAGAVVAFVALAFAVVAGIVIGMEAYQ